jgi:2-succinyl-6-hydroxy-2,4-cyclohexadiene-1-carboxylate synthase
MRYSTNNIALNVEERGAGQPLLLLHGFTGSAQSWSSLMERLAQQRRVLAVDLIGHGLSDAPADPARYTMEHATADLLALMDALAVDTLDLLGYSLGGRVALHLALAAPQRMRRLVLESASPGLDDADERAARVAADEALAARIERDGISEFVAYWEEVPLFASQRCLPVDLRERQHAQRLLNSPRGLANSLRGMGTGAQRSLWNALGQLTMQTLLIAGELDIKFVTIAQAMVEATVVAAQHAALAQNAEQVVQLAIVADAGHAVHLEQPERFLELVNTFLV